MCLKTRTILQYNAMPGRLTGCRLLPAGFAAAVALLASTGSATAAETLLSLCLAGIDRVTPQNVWRSWSLAPEAVIPLGAVLAAWLYGLRGRGISTPRQAAFLAGWALLAVALLSPLCRLAATLVTGHMIQHMLLITIAPMLLALARPGGVLRHVLPTANGLRDTIGALPRPGLQSATIAYGAAIWLWHVPAVYTLLLTNEAAHVAGFAALILVSCLFWSAIFTARPRRAMHAVVALLATMMHTGLLGALLTFGSRPFYPIVAPGALDWGLRPIQDQQIAGLIMWVPGNTIFMLAALAIVFGWLRHLESARSTVDAKGSSV